MPGALVAYGWSERVAALFNELDGPGLEPARVVRGEHASCVVVTDDGREQLVHASMSSAVGDWVAVGDESVARVLPRWSELRRVDPSGDSVQVLAANVDIVLVTAPADRLSIGRVERELAVAWDSGAQPVVVITKCDVAPSGLQESLADRLVGVEVVATSAASGVGVAGVAALLAPGRTAVMLGPSGAGKSSLANALVGADLLATGAVREGDHRGRHTTTSRQLIVVPSGGVLIDSPGLRSLGLSGDVDVEQAFPDIESLAADCRFRDCRHDSEPGCAVTAAIKGGSLDADRFASFRKLQQEVAAEAGRHRHPH